MVKVGKRDESRSLGHVDGGSADQHVSGEAIVAEADHGRHAWGPFRHRQSLDCGAGALAILAGNVQPAGVDASAQRAQQVGGVVELAVISIGIQQRGIPVQSGCWDR